MAKIIDGRKISDEIKSELAGEVKTLIEQGCEPWLSVVLVGANPASQVYVRMKTRVADALNIGTETIELPDSITEDKLLKTINELNEKSSVHAILVQLPLPSHIDENKIINAIAPEKDVDGFHPVNRGKLVIGEDTFQPCTPLGVQEMLVRSGIEIVGKHVVIAGRSKIVGLPLASILLQKAKAANEEFSRNDFAGGYFSSCYRET